MNHSANVSGKITPAAREILQRSEGHLVSVHVMFVDAATKHMDLCNSVLSKGNCGFVTGYMFGAKHLMEEKYSNTSFAHISHVNCYVNYEGATKLAKLENVSHIILTTSYRVENERRGINGEYPFEVVSWRIPDGAERAGIEVLLPKRTTAFVEVACKNNLAQRSPK